MVRMNSDAHLINWGCACDDCLDDEDYPEMCACDACVDYAWKHMSEAERQKEQAEIDRVKEKVARRDRIGGTS